MDEKDPYFRFKVENGEARITTDNRKKHLSELLGINGREYVDMRVSFTESGYDLF